MSLSIAEENEDKQWQQQQQDERDVTRCHAFLPDFWTKAIYIGKETGEIESKESDRKSKMLWLDGLYI